MGLSMNFQILPLKSAIPFFSRTKQQNVVYYYKGGLCDTDYDGFTSQYLHRLY